MVSTGSWLRGVVIVVVVAEAVTINNNNHQQPSSLKTWQDIRYRKIIASNINNINSVTNSTHTNRIIPNIKKVITRGKNTIGNANANNNSHNIEVEVWSGFSGWGLRVHQCFDNHDQNGHRNSMGSQPPNHNYHIPPSPYNHNYHNARPRFLQHDRESRQLQTHIKCDHSTPLVNQGFRTLSRERFRPDPPAQGEGITLSILNQRSADLIFHQVFPLGMYWAHWADLEWHLERVAPGRVVVMTVAVSGTVGLRHAAQQLAELGSLLALHLTPMAHWTWVFIKGGRTLCETATLHSPAPHHAHLLLPLSLLPTPNNNNQQRWHYCQAHGAMGGLCDEYSPDPLPVATAPAVGLQGTQALAGVPVVVTAGKRHQYLYQSLKSLLAAPGAQHNNILVILGDAPQATTQLLHLLQLNFITLPVQGQDNDKLFRYYRSVFHLLAQTFPRAPAVILLDEDVQVSPDFFSYMSQTLWLLHQDPTLYCINAHSITGFSDRIFNPSRVFRGDVQVQWGYAITLDFVREALAKWPEDGQNSPILIYDYWLYQFVRNGRECVYPEVGRSFHFGKGTNSGAHMVEFAFLNKPIVEEAGVPLVGVARLQQDLWRQDLSHNISRATPLLGNPCLGDFIPKQNPEELYVFYYRLDPTADGSLNVTQSFDLLNCLGGWSMSDQGQSEGVSIITLSAHTTLYLVGIPYSSYSDLRPPAISVWDVNKISEEEFIIVEENALNQHKFTHTVANRNMTETKLMNILSTQ